MVRDMKVMKQQLLILAGIAWIIAGFNVLKIGLDGYRNYFNIINISLSGIIFFLFWKFVFSKLVMKHHVRILNYAQESVAFYLFFDRSSYIVMIMMITMGVLIRKFMLLPMQAIAIFYTGLGSALFLAGSMFIYLYKIERCKEKVNMEKKLLNISFYYFILAMIAGVFFREFTKYNHYYGYTVLKTLHVHILGLGMLFFLIVYLLYRNMEIETNADVNRTFQFFVKGYNLFFILFLVMLTIRGILEVQNIELSSKVNAMISGFSGITHIGLALMLFLFFKTIKNSVKTTA